jgi:hypothetical protein
LDLKDNFVNFKNIINFKSQNQMLKQILTHLVAAILSLMSATLFIGIGILLIVTTSSILSQIIAVIFIGGGLFLGYKIHATVLSRGIIGFMTSVNASPDFDNLEPSANSNHKKYHLDEFIEAAKKSKNLFKGGYVRVWGNDSLKGMKEDNQLVRISSPHKGMLQLNFSNGNTLRLKNPENIFEGHSYLKILDCDKLEWKTSGGSGKNQRTVSFEKLGKKIEPWSNKKINNKNFNPNDPALLILK